MPTARYMQLQRIIQGPKVRDKLAQVADRLADRVNQLDAASPDPDVTAIRTDGTRPKGRPYSRVAVPTSAEYGDHNTDKRRLLGQAVTGR